MAQDGSTTLHLTRKEIDFPLGLGSSLIDVDIDMEWATPSMTDALTETPGPVRVDGTSHSLDVDTGEGGGVGGASVVQALNAAIHGGGVKGIVETSQASSA